MIIDSQDQADARELALEAGSGITSARQRDDLVLANAAPIEAFLLSGDGSYDGYQIRCTAVLMHMANLKTVETKGPLPLFFMDNPEEFLRAAGNYAGYLSGGIRGRCILAPCDLPA